MPQVVNAAYDTELRMARTAGHAATAWRAAERGHIGSPPWPWLHTVVHAGMPRRAVRERDRIEASGR